MVGSGEKHQHLGQWVTTGCQGPGCVHRGLLFSLSRGLRRNPARLPRAVAPVLIITDLAPAITDRRSAIIMGQQPPTLRPTLPISDQDACISQKHRCDHSLSFDGNKPFKSNVDLHSWVSGSGSLRCSLRAAAAHPGVGAHVGERQHDGQRVHAHEVRLLRLLGKVHLRAATHSFRDC